MGHTGVILGLWGCTTTCLSMGNGIFGEMGSAFRAVPGRRTVTTIRTTGAIEPYTDLELKKQIDNGERPDRRSSYRALSGSPGTFAVQMHQLPGLDRNQGPVYFLVRPGPSTIFQSLHVHHFRRKSFRRRGRSPQARPRYRDIFARIGFREAAAIGIDDLEHGLLWDTGILFPGRSRACVPITSTIVHFKWTCRVAHCTT